MESGRLCVAKWRAERYVSFERVWRRAERERRRFEREKPVVRIVWCMPERVVV